MLWLGRFLTHPQNRHFFVDGLQRIVEIDYYERIKSLLFRMESITGLFPDDNHGPIPRCLQHAPKTGISRNYGNQPLIFQSDMTERRRSRRRRRHLRESISTSNLIWMATVVPRDYQHINQYREI